MKKVKKMAVGGIGGAPMPAQSTASTAALGQILKGSSLGQPAMSPAQMGGPLGQSLSPGAPLGSVSNNPISKPAFKVPRQIRRMGDTFQGSGSPKPFGTALGVLGLGNPQATQTNPAYMKNGGMTASKRADGCAQRGKTKGRMV